MKKLLSILFVSIILFPSIFSFPSIVSANTEDSSSSCSAAFKDVEMNEKIEEFRDDKASILEKYAMDIMELIMNAVNINTLEQLIFGNPYCIWFDGWGTSEPEMAFGMFPQKVYDEIVEPGFSFFTSLFVICFCIAVMVLGLKMGFSGVGLVRVNVGEEFYMFFLTFLTLISYWMGVQLLFDLNFAIVSSLKDLILNQGVNMSSFSIVATADEFNFSDILLLFAEWALLLFLNVVYMMRLFLITILMMVGGLVIVGILFKSTRHIFSKWLLDFSGAIFMQSVHAIYFTVVILFVSIGQLSFVFKLALLILFLPLGSMMLNMMSFSSANMAVTSTSKGVAAVNSAMRLRNLSKGSFPKNTPVGELTTGQTKISALANATNSPGWGVAKTAAQTAGGLAGATAGLVIGGHGAALGSTVGASVTGAALQVPRNVVAGAKGILDTRKKISNNELNMNNISDKRQAYGSFGESVGTIFGKGESGRALGEKFSGVSKERLMNSTEFGGLAGVSLSDLSSKYPDAKVMFEQTNEGSAFYLANGDSKQQISPIGLADSTLPDGLTRTIEYSPTNQHSFNASAFAGVEHLEPNMNTSLYTMTGAPSLRDNDTGASVADNGFEGAAYFKPENHCNMGELPNSVQQLNESTPFENSKGGELT